ncbi:MAG: AsmA family protein [Nitrospirae bacterium]|nr:AsmA family protein [Nitrospirota bacterium]
MIKRHKKLIVIVTASILAVVLALTVFIKTFFTPERIKTLLLPVAERALDREIAIGKVDISLFKGIEISDFAIKEADRKTDFVRCKNLVLKYELLSLLRRKIAINELSLLSPEVNIVRNKEGIFNFKSIGAKKAQEEKEADKEEGLPLSLVISKAIIKGARFSFADDKNAMPDIKGSADIDIKMRSLDAQKLSSDGEVNIKFDEIKTQSKNIKNIFAGLKYSVAIDNNSNTLNIGKTELKVQNVPLTIKGVIRNFKDSPDLNISLLMQKTKASDMQRLISSFIDVKGLGLSGNMTADLKIEGAPKNLRSNGELRLDSLKYNSIAANNLYIKFALKDKRLEAKSATASVGKGRFSSQGVIDISKPGYAYAFNSKIESLRAEEIMNSFFPKAKDTVFGTLNANFKFNAAGTSADAIKRSLNADIDFNVKDGKITNHKMLDALAIFVGIDELRTINLRQANGMVKIKDGIARLDSIFTSDDVSMDPSGNAGVISQSIDLAFELKLSQRLTDKILKKPSIAAYVKDEQGRGSIPLKVSGTFAKPSYSVDIAKAGKRAIKKKAGELLEKMFNKDKQEGGEKKQKPVEDLLKGIFR